MAVRIATGTVACIGGSEGFAIGCRSRHNFPRNIGRHFLPYKAMYLFPGRVLGKCRVQPEPIARSLTHRPCMRLIRALQSLYWGSSACVRIDGAYTDCFDICRGIRQGCVASSWLFNLFMDSCLYNLNEYDCELRIDELSVKCLVYADDHVTLGPSACGLQEMVTKMNDSVKKRDMKVNVGKTKVMVFERDESTTECDILIEGEKVEQYAWRISEDRCRNSDVRERCDLKEDVVTRVERSMLRWFGRRERMNESRLTKEMYRANVYNGKVGKGHGRKSYADHTGGILKKGQILSTPKPTSLHEKIDRCQ
ncbi:hypothetical protein EVAR_2978_1 [Eumeta japonica]|uniref:Reverse transcriptase domain-containing protein n=1 Tax=Eumeta variegata TaxID=151549 RepID=A0A4C1SWP4_EUMVA|nr:hypothetical protein EVAR_2978_1 [Eumeta japonica]